MTELAVILAIILTLAWATRRGRRDYERQRELIRLRELQERAAYARWLAQQQLLWEQGGPPQMPLDQQERELGNIIPWPINPRDRGGRHG